MNILILHPFRNTLSLSPCQLVDGLHLSSNNANYLKNKPPALQKFALSFKFTHRCRWWNRKSPTWSSVSTCQVRAETFVQILRVILWLCQFIYVNWRWWCGAAFNDIRIPQCVRSRRTYISAIHYVYVPHSIELTDVTTDYDLVTFPHLCTHPLSLSLSLLLETLYTFCLQFIPRAHPSIGHISLHS